MDNNIATIPASYLKAASLCMAKKDMRFYLNGILLDFPNGYIVSTDGHRAFVGRLPEDCPKDWPAVIVPDSLVLASLKAMSIKTKSTESVFIKLEETDEVAVCFKRKILNVRIISTAGEFAAKEVDGNFPEYQRVIPRQTSGEPASYCFPYLVDATEALSWYATGGPARYKGTNINYNGNSAAVLWDIRSSDCIAIVMPMRMDVNGDMPNILAPRPSAERAAA